MATHYSLMYHVQFGQGAVRLFVKLLHRTENRSFPPTNFMK